jgi:hypothetical protein
MGRAIAFSETVAFLSSVIPAEAGIQRPKTRRSPLDSRFRWNDGNREVGEPKCDCPALMGAGSGGGDVIGDHAIGRDVTQLLGP